MTFDAKSKLRSIQGRDYLDVKWRIAWMREEHPDWGQDTQALEIGGAVIVKVTLRNASGFQVSAGTATLRSASQREKSWEGRDFEKAETAALGRALAHAGYGTQFAEEDGDNLSDAPVERNPQPSEPPTPKQPAIKPGTRKAAQLFSVKTRATKNGGWEYTLYTNADVNGNYDKIIQYERGVFKNKGYVKDNDWQADGFGHFFDPNIPCYIVRKGEAWEIEAATFPPFDPQFDGLGKSAELPGMPEEEVDVPF